MAWADWAIGWPICAPSVVPRIIIKLALMTQTGRLDLVDCYPSNPLVILLRIMAKKGIGVVIINEITDEADAD